MNRVSTPPPPFTAASTPCPGWCAALALVFILGMAVRPARAQAGYTACLGCAEHQEIRTRWHRPFITELAGAGLAAFTYFRVEGEAERMGLCETDPLIESPQSVEGCHPYSAARAWLIETPVELIAFTSPAWGLERRGHPRWAMALQAVPIGYQLWTAHETEQTIQQWQRLELLYY